MWVSQWHTQVYQKVSAKPLEMPAMRPRVRAKHTAFSVFRDSSYGRELIGRVQAHNGRGAIGQSNCIASQAFQGLSDTEQKNYADQAARKNEEEALKDHNNFVSPEEIECRRCVPVPLHIVA